MNRRNDCLIHLTPIKAQAYSGITPNRRLDQDVTSSYIHIKNYKCSKTTRNTVCAPLPLSSLNYWFIILWQERALILQHNHSKLHYQLVHQNSDSNTERWHYVWGFFFRGWVGTRVLFLSGWYISSFSVCIYPVHYSNLKLITAL